MNHCYGPRSGVCPYRVIDQFGVFWAEPRRGHDEFHRDAHRAHRLPAAYRPCRRHLAERCRICLLPPGTTVPFLGHAGAVTGGAKRGQDAAGVDFFVSHAGRDQAWAEWVAWQLVEAGYTVELDCWDWAAGENFLTKMHRALDAANRVVALFSPSYFEDLRYTTQEWTSALLQNDDGGHRLLPVQVEPCAVPRLLGPLVRVELFDVDETAPPPLSRVSSRLHRTTPPRRTSSVLTSVGDLQPASGGEVPHRHVG